MIPGFEAIERHRILQLISKAVRAAGLVESRARPHAAHQRLIQRPAIEQDVHRAIRRLHLHCAQNLIPVRGDGIEDRIQVRRAIALDQHARCCDIGSLAEEEHYFLSLTGLDLERLLQGSARVEPCADAF